MKLKILLLIILFTSLVGCGMKYPELEDDAIAFETSSYTAENDEGYLKIEYQGRIYMPYGTLKGTLKEENLSKCLGYIIEDENISAIVNRDSKATRVYSLTEDSENNYLMIYYIEDQVMNQPSFWRAIDSKGKDIKTPNYIESLEYNYWK